MGFLSPLFLVGLLAAAIPIAIHLFHRRTDPVIEFAAIRYLRRAPIEQSHRRRLRELLLLALRATAVTLLAVAFARPYFQSGNGTGASATVVLIDTSASLSAPDQFERARSRAHDAIRNVAAADAVAVATFASGVEVVAPLSADRAAAHAAVTALQPGAGATRYGAALARGAELLEGRPGRLIVVSDLQASGWDAGDARGVPRDVDVAVEDVGAPDTNLSVTSLRLDGDDAIAVVHNFSSEASREQVTFTIDGRPAGVVLVAVPAQGGAEARLAVPSRREGAPPRALSAAVADRFGYTADDTRYAVLDPAAAPAILAVTASADPSEAFFLERALTVGDGARTFRFTTRSGSAFSDLTAEALAGYDAVAILGTRGINRPARERLVAYVRSGGGVLLVAGPDVDAPADVLEKVVGTRWKARDAPLEEGRQAAPQDLALAPDDSRHPVLRPFGGAATLGNVTFRQAVEVTAPPTAAIVARYSDGTPALVEERVGNGRVLVFASDLNDRWNDFPLQPVFVPFVHETLRYLAAPRSVRTEYLVGEVAGPAGLLPGVVTRGDRPVAVNVDPRESDPSRMTADEFMAGVSRMDATAARAAASGERTDEDGQRLWQAALMLMVLSLVAEGVVGRRLV